MKNYSNARLMCVLAHPDDESLATGGILAHYGELDVKISLVVATRGERGWTGPADAFPGEHALGQLRERELLSAAEVLGIQEVHFLDYIDGDLDQAEPGEVINKIVAQIRRFRPNVVVTFDPAGAYGHPDHVAISQLTTAAIAAAANPHYRVEGNSVEGNSVERDSADQWPAHQVEKLYYLVWTQPVWGRYEAVFGKLEIQIDGTTRRSQSWAEWAVTTRIDTAQHWLRVWAAVLCHGSQLPALEQLARLGEMDHRALWGEQQFYRAMSLVNGGREIECDLFEGIRCDLPQDHYKLIQHQRVYVASHAESRPESQPESQPVSQPKSQPVYVHDSGIVFW